MRSTIIIATCALAVFAAPIAESKPVNRDGSVGGCVAHTNGACVNPDKRDVEEPLSKLNLPDGTPNVENPVSVHDNTQRRDASPEPAIRQGDGDGSGGSGDRRPNSNSRRDAEPEPGLRDPSDKRSGENTRRDAKAEPALLRDSGEVTTHPGRDLEHGSGYTKSNNDNRGDAEAKAELGMGRGPTSMRRDAEPTRRVPDRRSDVELDEEEQDVEARATLNQGSRKHRRSAEPYGRERPSGRSEVEHDEEEQDVEARATRNQGSQKHRRSAEPYGRERPSGRSEVGHDEEEQDVEARATRNQGSQKRRGIARPSGRSAEAAPAVRNPDP